MMIWIATPVIFVASSSVLNTAEMARKKEYVVMVTSHRMRIEMKNWDGVADNPAIQYMMTSKRKTWTKTMGISMTVCARA